MLTICRLVLLFAVALLATAQTKKAPQSQTPPPGVVQDVKVEGSKLYSAADIAKVLGLKRGATATNELFAEAKNRLIETDLFSNVAYEFRWTLTKPAQYSITYTVTEYDQLFPLQFEELGVSDDALRQYLRTHVPLYNDRVPGTDLVIRRYTSAVQEMVAETKPALKVRGFVSGDNPNQPAVVIRPDTPLPRISGVEVTGNQAIETAVLQRTLNDVAIGQHLSDARLRDILDHSLKPLYAAKGYTAISFPKIDSEKSKENGGYIVHVQIQEGPVFHFGSSAFRGGSFTADDVRSYMKYKRGEVYDGTKTEQLRRDLLESLKHQGFLDAKIELSTNQDDKNRAVNVIYAIAPGQVYSFQTLQVHGLDIESEPEIRKLWGTKPGKPFNPDYPEFFLKRVREMGMFDNLGTTHSSFKADESTHNVVVDLYFKGAAAEADKAKKLDQTGAPAPAPSTPLP